MGKPIYLYVTPFFPSPANWRGSYGFDFVRELIATGAYEVHVFVPGRGEDYTYQGVAVHRFRVKALPSAVLPFLFHGFNERSFLKKVADVGIEVRRVAVCHGNTATFGIFPLALKRLNPACKTLLHHHDLQSFGMNGGRLRHCWLHNVIVYPQLRAAHDAIDCHIFISEASRRSFLAAPRTDWTDYADYTRQFRGLGFYRGVTVKQSLILHNGVDTSLFMPAARGTDPKEKGTRNAGTGPLRIGCIGNFEALKDQISLIRAVERLDFPVQVIFVGSGSTLDACRAEAARVTAAKPNATFEFRAEVRHEQLPAFYRELDLFVLPSYFEGFGCVYTEAWCCGVPFIACEGQGIEDLIAPEDRALWLARPRDPSDLAAKIAHYHAQRPMQRLTGEVDIRKLVAEFVAHV